MLTYQKFILLRNAMVIICSFVKITTHTHDYIHTHTNTKKIIRSNCRDFCSASRLIYPGDNPKFPAGFMYHHTHTYYKSLIWLHTIKDKYNPHTHTHTNTYKELYTVITFFWLYFSIFSISPISFFLGWVIVVIIQRETYGRRQASMILNVYKN